MGEAAPAGNGRRFGVGSGKGGLFGPRPTIGPGPAGKLVTEDAKAMITAQVELAKAEVAPALRSKGVGAALMGAAGTLAFFAVVALFVAAGLALALVMPGWAAALTLAGVLLVIAVVLVLVGRRLLAAEVKLDATKQTLEENITWLRQRLGR